MFRLSRLRQGLFILVYAGLLGIGCLATTSAQDDSIVIDDVDSCLYAGKSANGDATWDEIEDRCTLAKFISEGEAFRVPLTVTVQVSETLQTGIHDIFLLPNIYSDSLRPGTLEISGTLVTGGADINLGILDNRGSMYIDGTMTNEYGVGVYCSRVPGVPSSFHCSFSYFESDLFNYGSLTLSGQLFNESRVHNSGVLSITAPSGGTIPLWQDYIEAASLSSVRAENGAAELVSEGEIINDGTIVNDGLCLIDSVERDHDGSRTQGFLMNGGVFVNNSVLGLRERTRLENRVTISNVGLLVSDGYLDNFGIIQGAGTIVNRGTLRNIGTLEGLVYNEGSILNLGTIDGDIVGPGDVVELGRHIYLPVIVHNGH